MSRKSLSNEQKKLIGNMCINCGETESIEYHHIVPLFLGGTDAITNIVPLCHRCHRAAHCGQHVSKYANHKNTGRKAFITENEAKTVMDMFINGEIGNKKCSSLLGYSKRTPINTRTVFKKYISKMGIESVHNLVDVVGTNRPNGLVDGACVGQIIYKDGTKQDIFYKDTGINDIEYRPRKNTGVKNGR